MGTIFSVLDSCGPGSNSPAAYMEEELQRETRFKKNRRKMDVMGIAIESAYKDIKYAIGV